MTAQINDVVGYAGADWLLAGANGEHLFDPKDFGLKARAASSACWRGFACRYELRDNKLLLDEIDVALDGDPPVLLGREPQEPRAPFGFTASYRGIGELVDFTGGLLLARDFVRDLYVHMGFHPAWKYVNVLEVELDGGKVSSVKDCSSAMAEIRERLAGNDRPASASSRDEIRAWIERAFSRRY